MLYFFFVSLIFCWDLNLCLYSVLISDSLHDLNSSNLFSLVNNSDKLKDTIKAYFC